MTHSTRTRRPGRGPAAGQQALLTAATRRGPVTGCTPAAERSHVTGRDDRELSFTDLPAENPNLLTADPQPAPVVVELLAPSPLRAGHEHADTVLHGLRTETPRLQTPDEHTVHHQLPRGAQLCIVPLVDPVDALCDSVELHIARFACAVSDLAVRPNGRHLLTMLLLAHADRPVSTYDRRPLGATVGRELETAVAA